jgi:hypothetical protein
MMTIGAGAALAAAAPESKRLGHAKDYIADEQWARAIVELQVIAEDPKESNRDEALFWLAHSEHQSGDDGAAIQTIARLEKQYPRSPWVKIAGSMRVEIAQRLRRDDLLWMMVTPPPTPRAVTSGGPVVAPVPPPSQPFPPPTPSTRPPRSPLATPATTPTPPPSAAGVPPAPAPPRRTRGEVPPAPLPPAGMAIPTEFWTPGEAFATDATVRIEALGSLIESHGDRAIPLLKDIAFDEKSPDEARRAVWLLAQSRRPDARNTVFEVARRGAEPVRIVAIREIGRFDGPSVNAELMQAYSTARTPRLKRQVVSSLGERADNTSLLRIAKIESDPNVRNLAIVTLGRSGAHDQLRALYVQTPHDSRAAVLAALFTARDDEELIHIAKTERDPALRLRARQQLRMLATPRAIQFLNDNP